MKRLMRAAFPLLVLMACAGSAQAALRLTDLGALPIRHYTSTSLGKRVEVAGGGSSGTALFYNDSLWVTWNSAAAQPALVADTTAWFTLPDRGFAPYVLGADSLSLLNIYVAPDYSQGSSPAFDTLTATLQGSFNGVDVAAGVAVDIMELGTSNCLWKAFNWTRGSTAATLTNVNIGMFPKYRIIVKDFTGTSGQFTVGASYWKDVGGEPAGGR